LRNLVLLGVLLGVIAVSWIAWRDRSPAAQDGVDHALKNVSIEFNQPEK
jgi:hypothetical protein